MTHDRLLSVASTLFVAASLAGAARAADPIRIVILSGQNVHDWKATTPFLEKMYNDAKKFRVVHIVNDVSKVTADTFATCDVVVSNWTCHPEMTGGPFTAEGKRALMDAIRSGKGMVSVHAASAACNDWEDFQEISGLTWKLEHTNHTSYHTFKVTFRDTGHPITRGLPDFWITDELYQKMVKMSKGEFHRLADAWADPQFGGVSRFEPMLITTQLGKGRGVNLLLGHDLRAMQNPAFQTLMLRSAEWVATGDTTIPIAVDWPGCAAIAATIGLDFEGALQAATQYAHGRPYAPLATVEQFVNAALSRTGAAAPAGRAALAARLAAALTACNTPEAKSFLCRQLAGIGTSAEVQAVAPLVLDESTSMMARFALERITGPAASRALCDALLRAQGTVKIGIVNSIGTRGEADTIGVLEPLVSEADPVLAGAAIAAIGKIGTRDAAERLLAARPTVADPMRPALDDALLACAERLRAAGDSKTSKTVFEALYAKSQPGRSRAAGLRGLATLEPASAARLLKEALVSNEPELRAMAGFIIQGQATEPASGLDTPALLGEALAAATTAEQKRSILGLLRAQAALPALRSAVAQLQDAAVADDAAQTATRIAGRLLESQSDAAQQALRQIAAAPVTAESRQLAGNLLRRLSRPRNLARQATASSPDEIDSDGAAGGDAAAIDGIPVTYWDEADNQKLYVLKLTWPAPVWCNAILITGYAFESFCPREFDIVCDGKVVQHVSGAVYDRENVEAYFEFPRTSCTSLELRITGWYGGSPAIRELEVYDLQAVGASAGPPGPPALKWQQSPASIALLNRDRAVWQFNYARDKGIPYFNPVNLLDGTELVWLDPPDHPHHHALWFAWKTLNGANYWENTPDGGVTEVTTARVATRPDFSAEIALAVSYHPRNASPVMTEKRTIRVAPPAADGSYTIDWTSAFTAGSADVELKGGTAGGGYAGMSVRISKDAERWVLTDSEGRRVDKPPAEGFPKGIHGERARWADFGFVSTLTGSPAGVAILDHPSNLRHPSQWHDCMFWDARFGYFSPAPLWSQPYTLPAGRNLALRYRIFIHPGRADFARIEKEFKAFSGQP